MFYLLQDDAAFQSHNIIVLVFKSLYQAVSNLTGMFGVTPPQVGIGLGAITLSLLLWSLVNGIRGKTSFSLSPSDTPDPQAEARRQQS